MPIFVGPMSAYYSLFGRFKVAHKVGPRPKFRRSISASTGPMADQGRPTKAHLECVLATWRPKQIQGPKKASLPRAWHVSLVPSFPMQSTLVSSFYKSCQRLPEKMATSPSLGHAMFHAYMAPCIRPPHIWMDFN